MNARKECQAFQNGFLYLAAAEIEPWVPYCQADQSTAFTKNLLE